MIERVRLLRFKQYKDQTVELEPRGITLIAGGNNAGKSTLLHALAVWEFCRTAIEMERGPEAFLFSARMQGLGLGDDEFSPVALPSLKHLWTNLKTQKEASDPDGYTLRILCGWRDDAGNPQVLEFGLALANDRLFVKVTESNLETGFRLPIVAYLPPFAGITDRETKVSLAIRRRRTGEGLAGAVLRNYLLEMHDANDRRRTILRGDRTKIRDAQLRQLRESDPWEVLQQTLRQQFGAELIVDPFRDEYHSYIKVNVVKGDVDGYQLKRWPHYNKRDLMVEGSGFLQWLSVYALATSPDVDVLLLDEPDAHLHPTLQTQLMESLAQLAKDRSKQVLVATHSAELLRHWDATRILEVRTRAPRTRYLAKDHQKVALLAGLGSDYAPRIDPIRKQGRVLFLEGSSDESMLRALADVLGVKSLDGWPIWFTTRPHKERKHLFAALGEEDIPNLVAVSLRDRDDEPIGTSSDQLDDKNTEPTANFTALKWRRRHLESYLIHPAAVARASGKKEDDLRATLTEVFGLSIGESYYNSDCPEALLQANGKAILVESGNALLAGTKLQPSDVAAALKPAEVCIDIMTFFKRLDAAILSTAPSQSITIDGDATSERPSE